jgi:heterodisulfide reductase subunit A-like polyferredoxin
MAVTEGNDGTETGCVHFVRGRVVEVTDWPIHPSIHPSIGGRKVIIRAEDTLADFVRRIPVDMVVLSVGLEPQSDARRSPHVQYQLLATEKESQYPK